MKTARKTATSCTITLVVQDVRPVEYEGQVLDHPQFFLRLQLGDGSSVDARISRTDYEKVVSNIVPL